MSDQMHASQFHSVHLHEDMCKGCTICVTGCPAEAIRVRNGKAHILEERCIDCGECIRHCPNKAKYSLSSDMSDLDPFVLRAALITPSIYGQFNLHYSKKQIQDAFISLGFTDVYDVSEDALCISRATSYLISHGKNLPKPLISSSCPTVIKLIQVRFPSLLDNILPLLPPVELTARRARKELEAKAKPGEKIGIFLISPCSAKITAARSPVGYDCTAMDGAFSFAMLYLPLVTELRKMRNDEKKSVAEVKSELEALRLISDKEESAESGVKIPQLPDFYTDAPDGLAWGRESGEAEYAAHFFEHPEKFNWITSCGIQQIIETLNAIEDGQMSAYDFAEIDACPGGCEGGPLMIRAESEGLAILRNRLRNRRTQAADFAARNRPEAERPQSAEQAQNESSPGRKNDRVLAATLAAENASADRADAASPLLSDLLDTPDPDFVSLSLTKTITSRPASQLSDDFATARKMMQNMEDIIEQLPGLDCGSCGAPNCRALAEDIVRRKAKLEDCVTIMKSQYEELLFGNTRKPGTPVPSHCNGKK
jgi:iron only hydrogenase large subunit-like protein